MTCFRFLFCLLTISVESAVLADMPLEYAKKVISARMKINSMEVKVVVKREIFEAEVASAELLSNSRFDYHFRLSQSISRVDCIEDRPKDPVNAAFQKFAHESGTVRLIPGNGDVIFTEQSTGGSQGSEPQWLESHLSINPVFIGFWPDHFELLNQFSPQEVTGLCSGEGISTTLTQTEGKMVLAGATTTSPLLKWEFQFDADLHVPTNIRLTGFSGEGTVDSITSKWGRQDGIAVPIHCTFDRTSAGEVIRSESWSLTWDSLNRPIQPEAASWVSMGIKNHDVVQFSGADAMRYGEWMNGKFREWRPSSIMSPTLNPAPDEKGFGRSILIAANLFVIGVLLLYFGVRRLTKRTP